MTGTRTAGRLTASLAVSLTASLTASLLIAGCGTHDVPPTTGDAPAVTGERLLAVPPPGWIRTFEMNEAGVRLVEFMPPGGNTEQWIDKVSFESFNGAGGNAGGSELPDPIVLIQHIAKERERECAGFEDYNTFSGFENNYPTSVRLLLCHRNKVSGRGEISMLKSVQGNSDFYVVQRTRRVEPYEDRQPPMTNEEMGLWSLYLRSISVCDDARPEHPCPASQSADPA
ncbi:MAG: hypothetical protein E2O54_11510 [Gammaproteobacteria bacterium]|nr:MAG: hypothetical protein E2O54_11510 [Gammaproteobacteria bacterium]